jgi:SAM-dependent methyltransferase
MMGVGADAGNGSVSIRLRTPTNRMEEIVSTDTLNTSDTSITGTAEDRALKAKHAAMWASGSYPTVVDDVVGALGGVLVDTVDVQPGQHVLDVAAGTGTAALPAARRGAHVTATDLTPELLEVGRADAAREGLDITWRTADAEALPYPDSAFDVVLSAIGVMFAPHHQDAADQLARVCRPGGTIGLLCWTPDGMLGALFATMKPFMPPPPPGAQPPPLWGGEDHLRGLFGNRVEWRTLTRDVLDVTAFADPHDYARHFTSYYGPTISARANAAREGREAQFDEALDRFCAEWNRGTPGSARFDMEYLVAVGTRR